VKNIGSTLSAVRYQLPEYEFKNGEMKQASAFSDNFTHYSSQLHENLPHVKLRKIYPKETSAKIRKRDKNLVKILSDPNFTSK